MSKLKAFLQPAVAGKKMEVFLSDRFQDEDGKKVPFVVQSISQEENERLSKMSMIEKTSKNGKRMEVLDSALYGRRMIVACTAEPNFKDPEICSYYGSVDPLEVPAKMLSIGEYSLLSDAIMEINGLNEAQKKFDEAKNS